MAPARCRPARPGGSVAAQAAQAAGDAGAHQQGEQHPEQEAGHVGGPGHRAERRADVGEQHLQRGPDPDQQEGRRAHELQEQAQRQDHAQACAREQRQVGADHRRHRAGGADHHPVGVVDGQHRGQVGHRPAQQEQQQEPPRPHHPLGGQAEDQQEHQVAQQVGPVRVQEQGGEQAQHAAVAQRRQPVLAAAQAMAQGAPGQPQRMPGLVGPGQRPDEGQPQRDQQQRRGPAQGGLGPGRERDEHGLTMPSPPSRPGERVGVESVRRLL